MADRRPPDEEGGGTSADEIAGRLQALGAEVRHAQAEAMARQQTSEAVRRRRRLVFAGGLTGGLALVGVTAGLALADSGGSGPGPSSGPMVGAPVTTVPTTPVPATTVPATTVPPTTGPAAPGPTAGPVPALPGPAAGAPATRPTTWRVRPGDSFWSIAVAVQTARTGAPPAPRQVAAYWSRLVLANLEWLPVRGDPDLIFPGQILQLPA